MKLSKPKIKRLYVPVSLIVIAFLAFQTYKPKGIEDIKNTGIPKEDNEISKTEDNFQKRYVTNLPLDYFEGKTNGGNSEYTYLDKMGYWGEIIPIQEDNNIKYSNLNEPFTGFENLPNKDSSHEPYWGDSVDVDLDGKTEKLFYYSTAMNHTPHILSIVKNDKVIFRAEGPSIQLTKTQNGDGFYTEEYNWNDIPTANTKITRYIYRNGKFIPVWYRNVYVLEVVK